jgi:hypothetical protein
MANNIIESTIMEFALNGVHSSDNVGTNNDFGDSLNTDADKLTINFKNDKNFQFSSLPANVDTLNSSILSNSVYFTPKPTSRRLNEYNNLNQNHIDYIFNSEKLKRPFFNENSNLTDLDQNKRTKQCYDDTTIDNLLFKLSNLENSVNRLTEDNKFLKQEVKEVKELETKYNQLLVINKEIEYKSKMMYENQAVLNVEIKDLQKEKYDLYSKYQYLLDLNTKTAKEVETFKSNEVAMSESVVQSSSKQYSDLFKLNNNKMSEPLQEIMKVVSNNEEEKKKRENNLIISGMKVDKSDKHFSAVKKLLNDIGINPNLVYSAHYLNSKNDQTPIKLVAYDTQSRNTILKAAKNLKQINSQNKSKIFIFQDLSIIDRQIHNELISKRNTLNLNLKPSDNHYFGIRNNSIARINKIKL